MRHLLRHIIHTALLLGLITMVNAQTVDGDLWWNTDYNSTEGTEFWATFMVNAGKQVKDKDLILTIYATARQDANVTVSGIYTPYENDDPNTAGPWTKTFKVRQNKIDSLVIPNQVAYLQNSNQTEELQWLNKGIKITSDKPIALYTHNGGYRESYDASLILPIEGLYKEYVIQTYEKDDEKTEFAIVSTSNDNTITINLRENNTITTPPITITLNEGQTFMYRPSKAATSLSGTTICSTSPIAVFQGGQYSYSDERKSHIYHQATSTDYWGKSFFVTRTANQPNDELRITAAEDNTEISKNGNVVKTLNRLETYSERIAWDNADAILYETSKATTCYLYHTERGSSSPKVGAPALCPITPTEQGIKSIILATFHETRQTQLNMVDGIHTTAELQDTINKYYKHYVNIVTQTSTINSMRMDGNPISGFTQIPNTDYSVVIKDISVGTHILTNSAGEFTCRVYGKYFYDLDEENNEYNEEYKINLSYAYSGGSNCLHPAHMLIDGVRKNEAKKCINEKTDFESVIKYDYKNIHWQFENKETGQLIDTAKIDVKNYKFPEIGTWDVRMIVGRITPICQYQIVDTVTASVIVSDEYHIAPSAALGTYRIVCNGDRNHELISGATYAYRTDTMEVGKTYEFIDRLKTVADCDSIVHIKVEIASEQESTENHTICSDQLPWTWKPKDNTGNDYSMLIDIQPSDIEHYPYTINDREQTLKTNKGCDHLVHLNLTIYEVPRDTTNDKICGCDLPYHWYVHGKDSIITSPGTYSDTIKSPGAKCYDIAVLNLDVHEWYYDSIATTICGNKSFMWSEKTSSYIHNSAWQDTTITTSGIYKREMKTEDNCPDIRILDIYFIQHDTIRDTVSICSGELPYKAFRPKDKNGEHQLVIEFKDYEELKLKQNSQRTDTLLSVTLKDEFDCDSVVQRLLTIYPQYRQDSIATICDGDSVFWEGQWHKGLPKPRNAEAGLAVFGNIQYHDTLLIKSFPIDGGCDSLRTLTINVNPREYKSHTEEGCEPYRYTFAGTTKTYYAGMYGDTIYYDTLRTTTAHGCEHIEIMQLTIYKIVNQYDTITISDKERFDWHNEHHDRLPGGEYDYVYSEKNSHDCTDTYHIHVIVQNAYFIVEKQNICYGETFQWINHRNDTILKGLDVGLNIVYDSLTSSLGQDSIHALELNVRPHYEKTLPTVKLCQGITNYSWSREDNGQIIQEIDLSSVERLPYYNTFNATLFTEFGCDSILHLPIEIHPTFDTTTTVTICEASMPYTWELIDTSGDHSKTIELPDDAFLDVDRQGLPQAWLFQASQKLKTEQGCDSIVNINLTVKPTLRNTVNITICPEQVNTFTFGSQKQFSLNDEMPYIETLNSNTYGCDSVVTYNITVREQIITELNEIICDKDLPYTHPTPTTVFNNLMESGQYTETLVSDNGCDSIVVLNLDVRLHTETDSTIYICEGDSYYDADIEKHIWSDSTYVKTLTAQNTCDSIVTMHISVGKTYNKTTTINLCESELPFDYEFKDTYGTEIFTLPTRPLYQETFDTTIIRTLHTQLPYMCDSIITLNITIRPTLYHSEHFLVCPEKLPMKVGGNGFIIEKPGVFTEKLISNTYKCDSVIIYTVETMDSIITRDAVTICSDLLPYNYNEHLSNLVVSNIYRDTLIANTGCDSIIILDFKVNKAYPFVGPNDTTRVEICDDETYHFKTLDKDTICNANGEWISIPKKVQMFVLTGMNKTINGCDSAVAHVITVHPTYEYLQEVKVCQDINNHNWLWIDQFGGEHSDVQIDISVPGDYIYADSLMTMHGCDSIFGIKIHVPQSYRFDSIYTICQNERISWQGKTYTGDSATTGISDIVLPIGTHSDTIRYKTIEDCDSTFILKLIINPVYDITSYHYGCANTDYIWTQYDIYGEHNDTIYFAASNDTVKLTTNQALLQQDIKYPKQLYHERMLTTYAGCDSLSRLRLTIQPSYLFYSDTTVCAREEVYYRGKRFVPAKDTTYIERFSNRFGCDSTYVLHIHAKPSYIYNRYDTICDNQKFVFEDGNLPVWSPGDIIPRPYDHIDLIYPTVEGCDSIYRFFLVVKQTYHFADTTSMCSNDSALLHGNVFVGEHVKYDTDKYIKPYEIEYADTLTSSFGCDSIYSLHALIYPQYEHTDRFEICDNETIYWREHTISHLQEGLHIICDSLHTEFGCDSIYRLEIIVHPTYFTYIEETICDDEMYNFNGKLTNRPGLHTDSLVSIFGCDSVFHLVLRVNPTTSEILSDTICIGEVYHLPNYNVTESGVYRDTTLNEFGCQHFIELNLVVIPPTKLWAEIDSICANERSILIHYTYEGHKPVEYSVKFNDLGHQQGFVDVIHAPVNSDNIIEIDVPHDPNDRTIYPQPNYYDISVFLHNGICQDDSITIDKVKTLLHYPSWIHEQHWNDAIVLFNEKYNGGYIWNHYQWYENGVPLIGQTKEYLYLPHFLKFGTEYNVALTRESDGMTIRTCPIIPTLMQDTVVPTLPYFSVVPTLMVKENPVCNILCTISGNYELFNPWGMKVLSGRFEPDEHHAMEVRIPSLQAGIYIFKLWADNGESRTTKVTVK